MLRALNSVTEDERAVAFLSDAETSRRLLLLRMILGAGTGHPDGDARLAESWHLLETAEKTDPAAFRAVLLDPQVGVWAAALLRRLSRTDSGSRAGEPPLRVELGFLDQLAAAVLIVAGADFETSVPVRDGRVYLPGLGRATVGRGWNVAQVRRRDGVTRIEAGGTEVRLPAKADTDAPGWEGLRTLRAEHAGVTLAITLDDLGPYSPVAALPVADRLSATGFAAWQRWFTSAWRILVDDHPAGARALATGLRSVVPLPRGQRLRPRTASSSEAFGCVVLSEPDEDEAVLPAQLGASVVHEFRHSLLNGLIFLAPLFEECGELFHAPWRDDPRPLGGLVHGAYAFSGVAHFWRTRGTEGLAGFEFALWRGAVSAALKTLHDHPALTPLGHALVRALREQTSAWHGEPVGTRELRLARLAARHHRAAWRAHHMTPPREHVAELMDAWSAGRRSDAATRREPVLGPDPQACRLDVVALLARLSLVAPGEFDALRRHGNPGSRIPGAAPAEVALVAGDPRSAVELYTRELTGLTARPTAWAGLGLALTDCGERAAGELLTHRPELALAVSRSLPAPPDPVALAAWLAG
ncbi:hypothetical protein IPT68_15770 [Streptomyces chromofuscus]|uniref:HEXXH motif domain-containing protein n=1 Tax=Streptomyces chromofuscus TaxID=42881 RepID=A0A7M2TER0_STRCW|nr:HEXXH motif domain-containing protein [Streptomyces chromofuscus]QOV47200.1 hypothetical protein IPT68_15770 [Streptomyces chromofuscus]